MKGACTLRFGRQGWFLVLALVTSLPGWGQVAPLHHWVGFTDKVGCGVDLNAPDAGTQLLSERALNRRAHHGIPLDSLDLPVAADRIAAVKDLGALENGQAIRILHRSRWFNGVVIQIDTAVADSADVAALLNAIASLEGVAELRRAGWYGVEPIGPASGEAMAKPRLQVENNSGASAYGASWAQTKQLRLDLLHGLGYRGEGLMVGVLDSGFDRVDDNPAFERARNEGRVQIGGNFPNGGATTPWIYQEHAHGAMVLSTMLGEVDSAGSSLFLGSAPDAEYVLFRTEDVHWEHLVEEYHWVAAAERADSMGCDVLNTSLGYSLFDDTTAHHLTSELDGDTFRITEASDIAARKGMLVFNSAGNSGNSPWQKITAPADGDSVLAVGAVDAFGQHASFSSYGPTADGRIKPDLCATGRNAAYIHPDGSIREGNGTSFSSPILCGAAVSLWSAHPEARSWDIRRALLQSASQWTAPDTIRGFGIADLWEAHLILGGQQPPSNGGLLVYPNPVTTVHTGLEVVFQEDNLLASAGSPLRWTILDGLGRPMAEGELEREKEPLSTMRIDTGALPSGQYILTVQGVPEEDLVKWPTAWARFIVHSP